MLDGKSVIVTGAGSGIGAAAALLAAESGARVTVADVDEVGGGTTVEAIVGKGGDAQFVRTDISDEAQVEALIGAAVARYGRLDAAFNNAGIASFSHVPGNTPTLFGDLPLAALRQTFEVNAIGTFLCMRAELRAMLATGGGAIVNTASNAGILAVEAAADYVGSKHAVIGLTKAAALDYAKRNIRVNALLPGVVRTKMMELSFAENPELEDWAASIQPVGRYGQPRELAEAAVWLMSDRASFVTGISLSVDGGYSMV